MVMDATPSPQSVGREFVRQYYTLLNKAPHHLHRFYNHQSSFVHGGLEPANSTRPDCLVIGQKQIHNKIQQLNFRDCHAKISQVDAQATLGEGVVVQVTGELSNDGQPMRRFTQTFVLAAQAPKKYYVHNDIFRYQDLVWDEDQQQDGGEQDSDARSEEVNETEVVTQAQQQQTVHHVPMQQGPTANAVAADDGEHQQAPQQQQQQGQMFYNAGAVKPAPGMFPNAPVAPTLNGHPQPTQTSAPAAAAPVTAATNEVHRVPAQQVPVVQPQQAAPTSFAPEPVAAADKPVIVDEVVKEKPAPAPVAAVVEEVVVEKKPPQPETFASLVKSGGGAARVMSSRGPGAQPVQPVSVVSPAGAVSANAAGLGGGQNHHSGSNHNTNNSSAGGVGAGNVRERRSSTNNSQSYGDSQQLFVGNIPHHATEEELKAMFSKYGVVLDLRIFTKQNNALPGGKGATGRVPQNYGFVTFKESESAQAVLANVNISFPDDSPDGQKLNIEEKMQRVGDRDRRSMGGSMNGGGMGNGGSRGMGRGGGMQGSGGMGMRNSGGPRGSGGDGRDGRNGTGPRGGSGGQGGGGGGGSYNRSQIIRNGSAGGGGGGLTTSGSGNTYGGRR